MNLNHKYNLCVPSPGPTGVLIQQHHYQARPAGEPASRTEERDNNVPKENGSSMMNNNHPVYQVDGKCTY